MRTITIEGEKWELPHDHTGTWGHNLPKRKVVMYTDGSLQKQKNKTTGRMHQTGGWGLVIKGDWMKKNWKTIHEDLQEQYRINEIRNNIEYWGRHMGKADSSYQTELSVGIKGMMILPASWDVIWITDSESSKKTTENKEAGTASEQTEWQLKQLMHKVLEQRTGTLQVVHQHSYKRLWTEESVRNETADVVADMFTKKITNRAGMKGLPLGYNNKRYMYKDEDTGGWLRVPIRRRMRKGRREEIEEEWLKGTGSQDEVIKDIGGVALTIKNTREKEKRPTTNR